MPDEELSWFIYNSKWLFCKDTTLSYSYKNKDQQGLWISVIKLALLQKIFFV